MNLRVGQRFYDIFIQLILIVVGVLAALAVENYRQTLQERRTEGEYLVSLRHAVRADTAMVKNEIRRTYTKIKAINKFLALVNSSEVIDEEEFGDVITDILMLIRLNHVTAVYEELKFTGNLKLIQNNELKQDIISYYNDISIIQEEYVKRTGHLTELMKELTLDELDFKVPFDQRRIFKAARNSQALTDELLSSQKDALVMRTTMIYTLLPKSLNLLERLQAELDADL